MNTNPLPASSPIQRHLPRFLFAVVALPVAVFLIWYLLHRWSDASVIQRLEAKARKNGEPLTYPELAASYPQLPDNQNGAARLMDAWEKDAPMYWRLFRDGERNLPERGSRNVDPIIPYVGMDGPLVERTNDIGDANLKAAEAYLQERQKHLDEIRAALANANFWFPIDISNGEPAHNIPHLIELKQEALTFSLQALVSGEHGDLDSAISAIEDTAHAGNALVAEPLTISQLVRLACYHIALSDSERFLSRRTLSAAQLNRLARLCAEIRVEGGMRLAFFSERVQDLYFLENLERNPYLKFFRATQTSRRTILTHCDHLSSLGDPYTLQVLREYDSSLKPNDTKFNNEMALVTPALAWTLLDGLDGLAHKFAVFEIHRRAAITALAVEQYRIENRGNLSKQLSDLVPKYLKELPLNPIDGKPLIFKQLPVGFVVYSVDFQGADVGWDDHRHRGMNFTVQR